MDASNYVQVCKTFGAKVELNAASPVGSPQGSPFDAAPLGALVTERSQLLPAAYRDGYARPLVQHLPSIAAQLRSDYDRQPSPEALSEAKGTMDTLVGAVRDWGEAAYGAPLRRFEAVVSNLYRSFLSEEQRAHVALPLRETVPPLCTFAPTPDAGPFTLPVDAVKQLAGAPVGVVSLPGAYAAHPLLWPALAHETGGHDVLHADPGLLDELQATVRSTQGALGSLWAFWMDEAASDVYGLLNIGPSFAFSLASFFSALLGSEARHAQPSGVLRTRIEVYRSQPVDVHPTDLLRIYLARGVVRSLTQLSGTSRQRWLDDLQRLAEAAGGGATAIDVVELSGGGAGQVVQSIPLERMATIAENVGSTIATAKLRALAGHSVQDIETWSDTDEAAASAIAAHVAGGAVVGLGDDAQLLAGATMALFATPAKYGDITSHLATALDDSFHRDPVFGRAAPHSFRGPSRGSRTPASPLFPLSL